mmetsp:Transcript_3344/g.8351  ORF Transcript_3344/g.8351 Transcript_3344/m.8351 type:complete len:206 (-) Transcript_3344:282-899(-)
MRRLLLVWLKGEARVSWWKQACSLLDHVRAGVEVALDGDALAARHKVEVLLVPDGRPGRDGDQVAGLVGPVVAVVGALPHRRRVLAAAHGAQVGAREHERPSRPGEAARHRGAVPEERRARAELVPAQAAVPGAQRHRAAAQQEHHARVLDHELREAAAQPRGAAAARPALAVVRAVRQAARRQREERVGARRVDREPARLQPRG